MNFILIDGKDKEFLGRIELYCFSKPLLEVVPLVVRSYSPKIPDDEWVMLSDL